MMGHRGSFRQCWRRLVETLGHNEEADICMVHDPSKEVYKVDHWSNVKNDLEMDFDGELRLVMRITRSEAMIILEGFNLDLLREGGHGGA
jgi:hypothetical protein